MMRKLLAGVIALVALVAAGAMSPALAQDLTPAISASAAATALVAKAAPGRYYDAYCQSSAAGRCIVFNGTAAPTAGALPPALVLECVTVPAAGQGSVQYTAAPRIASVGVVVLFSTGADCNTYTASSTAYIHATVQ